MVFINTSPTLSKDMYNYYSFFFVFKIYIYTAVQRLHIGCTKSLRLGNKQSVLILSLVHCDELSVLCSLTQKGLKSFVASVFTAREVVEVKHLLGVSLPDENFNLLQWADDCFWFCRRSWFVQNLDILPVYGFDHSDHESVSSCRSLVENEHNVPWDGRVTRVRLHSSVFQQALEVACSVSVAELPGTLMYFLGECRGLFVALPPRWHDQLRKHAGETAI